MRFSTLIKNPADWMTGGQGDNAVLTSRIRLARNLRRNPFPGWAKRDQRAAALDLMRPAVEALPTMKDAFSQELGTLNPLQKQVLVERHLISREHAARGEGSAVVIERRQTFSLMLNEEDHLRIQVMHSGLDLENAWQRINRLDDLLEGAITYAFHPKYGYLTACPTNVGTGLRVSVMMHLPALVITRQIDKVFRSLQKISVTVRGLYGEGSQYTGDFYQVSNQITLGKTETELMQQVSEVVPLLIDYERRARQFLVEQSEKDLHDDVSRALGILCTAKKISSEETMHYLSKVRMGVNLGLIEDVPVKTINKLFIHTQPAHLQKLRGRLLGSSDRNIERATYLQQHLSGQGKLESDLN